MAAACILTAIGMSALWQTFTFKKNIEEQEIYKLYFKPLTHPDATIRGENNSTVETQAVRAYEKEDYFASVHYYENLVSDDPKNIKNNLFLGISLLATNQSKKSIEVFKKIYQSEEYHYDIQWYLALAYIKNKEILSAKVTLSKLISEENYYQKEALEIMKKLDGKMPTNN